MLVLLPELYLVRNLGRVFIDTFQAEPLKHIHLLRKTAFLSHLYIKTIVLPRQARAKHRETLKKRWRFSHPFVRVHRLEVEAPGGRARRVVRDLALVVEHVLSFERHFLSPFFQF